LRIYRVFDRAYRALAMTGEGAASTGGRWNSKGIEVVYASDSLALALLEMMANARRKIPPGKVYVTIDIPDDVRVDSLRTQDLPARWTVAPAPRRLAEIGDDWIRRKKTLALLVPSAIVPVEHNVLLNPAHADFKRLAIGSPQRIPVDPRLQIPNARRTRRR
jgi:RES domain-containing protein